MLAFQISLLSHWCLNQLVNLREDNHRSVWRFHDPYTPNFISFSKFAIFLSFLPRSILPLFDQQFISLQRADIFRNWLISQAYFVIVRSSLPISQSQAGA